MMLTGCETEAKVDKLVLQYVKDEFGLEEVEITYRGGKDESNMGDRSYSVKSKTEPSFEFDVFLEGLINSRIVGDDFAEQEDAYKIKQQFVKTYEAKLKEIGVSDRSFHYLFINEKGLSKLEITGLFAKTVSLNDEQSIKHLFTFIQLINEYSKSLETDYIISDIRAEYPLDDQTQALSFYKDVAEIKELSDLKTILLENSNFVNEALLQANITSFQQLEKDMSDIGFSFRSGLNDLSIFCSGENIIDGKCSGYTFYLEGKNKSESNMKKLKAIINNHPIPVAEIVISNEGGAIRLKELN